MVATAVIPVTLLTGFLGSGKTTILNRLVTRPESGHCAVIVNEWGAVAIDHALVRRASENIVLLPSGCICCQVAGDLVTAMRDLHFKRAAGEIPAFDRAIIETTGLADPAPLLRTLIELPLVAARYTLSGVVTAADGQYGLGQLGAHPEAAKQAAVADRIVITKSDLASGSVLADLDARLVELNPGAPRIRATRGDVPPDWFFDTGLYRGPARVPDPISWLNAGAYRHAVMPPSPRHDPRVSSFVWFADEALEWPALEDALAALLDLAGDRILRLKGLVNVRGLAGPVAIHAVQHTLYPPAILSGWPDDDLRTRLVFITRDLEESFIAQTLGAFVAPNTQASISPPNAPDAPSTPGLPNTQAAR